MRWHKADRKISNSLIHLLSLSTPTATRSSPMATEVSPAEGAVSTIKSTMLNDLTSYFGEYFSIPNAQVSSQKIKLLELIAGNDVVVLAKVNCGFCQKAKKSLAEEQLKQPFTMHVLEVVGNPEVSSAEQNAIKKALSILVGLYDITYPQIIIRGLYAGGADDLLDLVADGHFEALIKGENRVDAMKVNQLIRWVPQVLEKAGKPQLLVVPKMRGVGVWYPTNWPFYTFQWVMCEFFFIFLL
jgi:glutaredoxin